MLKAKYEDQDNSVTNRIKGLYEGIIRFLWTLSQLITTWAPGIVVPRHSSRVHN